MLSLYWRQEESRLIRCASSKMAMPLDQVSLGGVDGTVAVNYPYYLLDAPNAPGRSVVAAVCLTGYDPSSPAPRPAPIPTAAIRGGSTRFVSSWAISSASGTNTISTKRLEGSRSL